MPQASVYGLLSIRITIWKSCTRPPDVTKAAWEADERSGKRVESYMCCPIRKVNQDGRASEGKAQKTQRKWYDLHTSKRSAEVEEKDLVLLPISINKLLHSGRGPTVSNSYTVSYPDPTFRCCGWITSSLRI